jgi:hypothetical protein
MRCRCEHILSVWPLEKPLTFTQFTHLVIGQIFYLIILDTY